MTATALETFLASQELGLARDSLAHYGKLGMRWGHRKAEDDSNFVDAKTGEVTKGKYPANSSTDHIKSREIAMKPLHAMTNDELVAFTRRLGLEKQYSEVRASKSKFTKGQAFLKKAVSVAKTAEEIHKIYNGNMVGAITGKSASGYKPKHLVP
jgi:hypothetical protein